MDRSLYSTILRPILSACIDIYIITAFKTNFCYIYFLFRYDGWSRIGHTSYTTEKCLGAAFSSLVFRENLLFIRVRNISKMKCKKPPQKKQANKENKVKDRSGY